MLVQYSREAKPSSFGSKIVLGMDSGVGPASSFAVTTLANERMSLMVVKSGRDAMNCARHRYKKKKETVSSIHFENRRKRESANEWTRVGKLRKLSSSNDCIQVKNPVNLECSSSLRPRPSRFLSLLLLLFKRYKKQKIHDERNSYRYEKIYISLSPR